VSRDVIWQPGHEAEDSITATGYGLGDGRETSGRGDRVIADKLVPFDLQQLSLALHTESLEGSGIDREEGPGFSCIQQYRLHQSLINSGFGSDSKAMVLPDVVK